MSGSGNNNNTIPRLYFSISESSKRSSVVTFSTLEWHRGILKEIYLNTLKKQLAQEQKI
ncbi:hypothetical protein HanHA300_Chr09g0309751 [Helianthus annuus]|nr:hypothetical protein HanHA300_Chr09g0309751 [Helianthus annuus]